MDTIQVIPKLISLLEDARTKVTKKKPDTAKLPDWFPTQRNVVIFVNHKTSQDSLDILSEWVPLLVKPNQQLGIFFCEPLDMEGRVENLISAILARLKASFQDVVKSGKSFWEDESPSHLWDQFQIRTAGLFNGNLWDRSPYLDGDAYAGEMVDMEKSRLGYGRALTDLLEDVVVFIKKVTMDTLGRNCDPLFIIPILNVHMISQYSGLIRAIKTLQADRFVFLLMGDLDMFRSSLYLHHSSNFKKDHLEGVLHKLNIPSEKIANLSNDKLNELVKQENIIQLY